MTFLDKIISNQKILTCHLFGFLVLSGCNENVASNEKKDTPNYDYAFYFTVEKETDSHPPKKKTSAFFQISDTSNRIAYVIDFSASMKEDGKESLLRTEIKESLSTLSKDINYSIIRFTRKSHYHDEESLLPVTLGSHWHKASPVNIARSLAILSNTQIDDGYQPTSGTMWEVGLNAALDLNPPPQTIYFMTDGETSGNAAEIVRNVSLRCKNTFPTIRVHCVCMKEPKLSKELLRLSLKTGGEYRIVH